MVAYSNQFMSDIVKLVAFHKTNSGQFKQITVSFRRLYMLWPTRLQDSIERISMIIVVAFSHVSEKGDAQRLLNRRAYSDPINLLLESLLEEIKPVEFTVLFWEQVRFLTNG